MKTQIAKPLSRLTIFFLPLIVLCFMNTVLVADAHDHEHGHGFEFSFFSLVKLLGLCALGFLLATFTTGLFRKKFGKRFLKIHKTSAYLTIIFALCHGILVLIVF